MSDPSNTAVAFPTQRWLTVDEAAQYLRLSPGAVRKLIHEQEIKASREGNGYRLDRQDLDARLERRKKFHGAYRKGTHPWVAERWAEKREKKGKRVSR
jgi:excisionase family DNA binding protein